LIFDKLKKTKTTYNCFYDSEFNAYDDNKNLNIPQEVVSIGICITNFKGVIIEKFYSLISLKAAKRISNRCTEITGIKTRDLKDAENFESVSNKVVKLLKKYNIKRIYCYGLEDKRVLEKTIALYDKKRSGKIISKMLYDVREDFKKKSKGKVWDQGLPFLKGICEIEGPVMHDALQDAIDLALIYYKLINSGYNEAIYDKLCKEREELISYKRNRRIKEENATVVSADLVKSKNKLVDYLEKNDILHMDAGAKKAMIDDLNLLFIGE
jgi:inhibitor of KinA sporulation pathway (predicted exonuclease)